MADRRFEKVSYYRKAIKLKIKRAFLKISEVFGCTSKGFLGKIRGLFKRQAGVVAILVAAFIPVLILSVNYLIKYTQKSRSDITVFEVPYVIGKAVAGAFNPGKSWNDQKEYLYSVAAQIYNDLVHTSGKAMEFQVDESTKVVKAGSSKQTTSVSGLFDFYRRFCTLGRKGTNLDIEKDQKMFVGRPPFANFSYDEKTGKVSYTKYSVDSNGTAYSVSKYKEDSSKLGLSLNDGVITVSCPKLGKFAEITLPRNDVDIIVAIPTNNTSTNTSKPHIGEIAKATQEFLRQFLHTAGVAVGIVPYSGKVSLSPEMADVNRKLTTSISMSSNPGNLPYVVQAMFYGSDGQAGGDITGSNYGSVRQNWGYKNNKWYETPIMARRGTQITYRNMTMNSGASSDTTLLLDMTTNPASGSTGYYKFMRMNRNPCYLGFCNTLAMACEKNCPTYKSNPYFMTELTSDISGLIYDMELLLPFDDPKNKSNFLFLPIVMAGNLLSWGSHPFDSDRANRKRVVIIIANAPDHFEPMELTYLGFNNDYSEIPMIESDTIVFYKSGGYSYDGSAYKGAKGAVQFTADSGEVKPDGYLFPGSETSARISFLNKGLLKIVTNRPHNAKVTVYGNNGVTENVNTHLLETGKKTLKFKGPQQVMGWTSLGTKFESGNYTTKGPNFGHNLSVKKVKIKLDGCKLDKATLTNQILRYYNNYDKSEINNKELVKNSQPITPPEPDTSMKLKHKNYRAQWTANLDPGISITGNIIYNPDVIQEAVLSNDPGNEEFYGVKDWTFIGKDLGNKGSYQSYFWEKCTRNFEQKVTSESMNGLGVCGFKVSGSGINDWNFVAAMDHFDVKDVKPDSAAVIFNEDDVILGTNEKGEKVKYNTSDGVKYQTFTGADFGSNKIKFHIFYNTFATQKKRTRDIEYTIVTKRVHDKQNLPISVNHAEKCCGVGTTRTQCSGQFVTETGVLTSSDGGERKCKGLALGKSCITFKDPPYWCGKTERSYSVDENGIIWDDHGLKCKNDPGDDIGGNYYFSKKIEYVPYECNKPDNSPNTDAYNCTNVCWNPYEENDLKDWAQSESSRLVSCSALSNLVNNVETIVAYYPTTSRTDVYSTTQSQYSKSCAYFGGSLEKCNGLLQKGYYCNYNSICKYGQEDWIAEPGPLLNYGTVTYSGCNLLNKDICGTCESPSKDKTRNRLVTPWRESLVETGELYAAYYRREDGTTFFPVYSFDRYFSNNITPGSNSGLEHAAVLRNEGVEFNYGDQNYQHNLFRYNLHNFFVVSKDTKSTTYEWSDGGSLTGAKDGSNNALKILDENTTEEELYSELSQNKGVYLLPVKGEENTYWVCFCGDADLQLNFSDISSSVQFSNIEAAEAYEMSGGQAYDPETGQWVTSGSVTFRKNYALNLNGTQAETVGVDVNYIDNKKIFYIHPDQMVGGTDDSGNYYVGLKIKGDVCIQSIELTNRPLKEINSVRYYDHPNIINDSLINTRIIDGYDQGKNKQMKLYGNILYDTYAAGSVPTVTKIQELYYSKKDGTATKYIYPNTNAAAALVGEEGDFFIQLWDYGDNVPEIRWKVGDKIQEINVNTEFGSFKSKYYFSGLHRMFFPYTTYNKDWAGYSQAKYSAQVFMGYTLPINYILASNGYQEAFRVDNDLQSSYTKSDAALKTLATDACTKLKTDLSATVYLVNYNSAGTNNVSHMSDCADDTSIAKSESDLTTELKRIALKIVGNDKTEELKVEVGDLKELTSGL